jgi:hypothetical protein
MGKAAVAGNFKVTLFPSGGANGGVNDLLNFIKANPTPAKNPRRSNPLTAPKP